MIGYPGIGPVSCRKMKLRLDRMTSRPVSLLFLKTALQTQVGGNAESDLTKNDNREKNKKWKYDNPFVQNNIFVCNVTQLIAAAKAIACGKKG